jgi:hypothetical protein
MSSDSSGESPVEQAFASGTSQRVGGFRFYFEDKRSEWSPEVEQIHGYQPGTVTPTTALVLSHKHPDDYVYVAATLADIRRTHKPFSTRHRADVRALKQDEASPDRVAFDRLLLTAHHRAKSPSTPGFVETCRWYPIP